MKDIVQLSVFLASFAVVICRPQFPSNGATILQQSNNFNGMSPWRWNFQTSNGISREEEGSLVDEILEVKGRYSWTAPDGSLYIVTYKAGKDGYTPQTEKGRSGQQNAGVSTRPGKENTTPSPIYGSGGPGSIGTQVDFNYPKPGQAQDLGVNAQLSLIG